MVRLREVERRKDETGGGAEMKKSYHSMVVPTVAAMTAFRSSVACCSSVSVANGVVANAITQTLPAVIFLPITDRLAVKFAYVLATENALAGYDAERQI
jgi:hypothetical protein